MTPLDLALLLAARHGWTQADLAARINSGPKPVVTKQMMTNWKSRGLPAGWHAPLARALGVSVDDLLAGNPAKISFDPDNNVSAIKRRAKIPMVDLSDAPPPLDFQPTEWVEPMFSDPGPRSFAVRVSGDSMMSPAGGAPTFPEGTVLVADQDRVPKSGDFVIAREPGSGGRVFKRLMSDGARWFLRPMNPAYPSYEIPDTSAVIAVVTESFVGQRY